MPRPSALNLFQDKLLRFADVRDVVNTLAKLDRETSRRHGFQVWRTLSTLPDLSRTAVAWAQLAGLLEWRGDFIRLTCSGKRAAEQIEEEEHHVHHGETVRA